jgi:hypothetical protein
MANDNFSYAESASDAAVMAAVRRGVTHVIFIIKENRTYDQVLGDLANGSNGDPRLTEFGEAINLQPSGCATRPNGCGCTGRPGS